MLLFSGVNLLGQNTFKIESPNKIIIIKLNGKTYSVGSKAVTISTNYPDFDTLSLSLGETDWDENIICNFKPDSIYILETACCGSIDIFPSDKLKNDSLKHWNFSKDIDKIHKQLLDKPNITIRTKSHTTKEIFAWIVDPACDLKNKSINKPWQVGVPPKCNYWSNITNILFYKIDNNMPEHKPTQTETFLNIENIVEINSIRFRLFDDENFEIIVNIESGNVIIEYQ